MMPFFDALRTLEQLKEDGAGLRMIDLGGDVCGNGISKLVFKILSAVAENERDRIREHVRDAKPASRLAAADQWWQAAPCGFDVEGEGKDKHLVPNVTEQAALVLV
jgi:DNA invertase Pin-like site-specific DNA recombinase